MPQNRGFTLKAGNTPPLKIVYRGMNLVKELETVRTDDQATKLTLQALGEELVWTEGLVDDDDLADEETNTTLIIPIDEFEE